MANININELTNEMTETQEAAVEEFAQVMGGATAKPAPKPKPTQQYMSYELENVLISSYS